MGNYTSNLAFVYDDAGSLENEQATIGNQPNRITRYTYDLDGNVSVITYPNGNTPGFSYDNQQRCAGMNSVGVTFSQYNYSADWLIGRWLYNGLYTGYGHQNNGRVADVWHYHGDRAGGHAANGSVSRHAYGYAPNGNISWFDREDDGHQSGSALENERGDVFYYSPAAACTTARATWRPAATGRASSAPPPTAGWTTAT